MTILHVSASPAADRKQLVVLCTAAYCIALGVRLLELPGWSAYDALYKGEHLLATHDAYHWLAAATGFEFDQQHPLARMLAFLHSLTGIACGNLAFYLPAVMACLVAPLMVGWGAALGMPLAGFTAGLLTACAPGLMTRTGLGYYDTDLLISGALIVNTLVPALWLRNSLHNPLRTISAALRRSSAAEQPAPPPAAESTGPVWFAVLLCCGLFVYWQPAIHNMFNLMGKAFPGIALVLAALLGRRAAMRRTAEGLLIYIFCALAGPAGAGAAMLLWLAGRKNPRSLDRLYTGRRALFAALVLLAAATALEPAGLNYMRSAIKGYSGEKSAVVAHTLSYPSVVGSIIEAQKLSFDAFLTSVHGWTWLAAGGLALFFLLMLAEPVTALLLPLAAMGLGSVALGARFAMFAAPCFALGTAWALHLAVHGAARLAHRNAAQPLPAPHRRAAMLCSVAAACIMCWPSAQLAAALAQGPIISTRQVEALDFIRGNTPEDSMLWYWWDWGYAAQYYARRTTVADGARHSNQRIYAPAAVLTTDVPRFANQLIKYVAGAQPPVSGAFAGLDAGQTMEKLHSFYLRETQPSPPQKQYLIVSAEQLRLGAWISRFGTWDFNTRQWEETTVLAIDRPVQYSPQKGLFLIKGLDPMQAESLTVFEGTRVVNHQYPHFSGRHFVIDKDQGMILVVDRTVYNSMALQLLVNDGSNEDISRYFRLVFSNGKTKVYEVL